VVIMGKHGRSVNEYFRNGIEIARMVPTDAVFALQNADRAHIWPSYVPKQSR
jgi:hypothetical protein